MTTNHTDAKKPADSGLVMEGEELLRPMLPSSSRCIWISPETDQGRWELKERMERLLDRLNKALWVFDTQHADDMQRRIEIARRDVLLAMEDAISLEAAMFKIDPGDKSRHMATFHFDNLSSR